MARARVVKSAASKKRSGGKKSTKSSPKRSVGRPREPSPGKRCKTSTGRSGKYARNGVCKPNKYNKKSPRTKNQKFTKIVGTKHYGKPIYVTDKDAIFYYGKDKKKTYISKAVASKNGYYDAAFYGGQNL